MPTLREERAICFTQLFDMTDIKVEDVKCFSTVNIIFLMDDKAF
jgi:hypothetical protein